MHNIKDLRGESHQEKKKPQKTAEPWPKPLLLNWPHQGYYVSRKTFWGLFITARFEDITRGKRHYSRGDVSMPVLSLPVLSLCGSGGCAGGIHEVKRWRAEFSITTQMWKSRKREIKSVKSKVKNLKAGLRQQTWQEGCDDCLRSLQVFLVRKSKSFLKVEGLDINSSGGGWEDAVWSQSNFILAFHTDRCVWLPRTYKPPLFSVNFCIRNPFQVFMAQPDLLSCQFERRLWDEDMKQEQEASTCLLSWLRHSCWRTDHVLVMDPEEPSSTATSKSCWSWHLKTCSPPPPILTSSVPSHPHPLAPSAVVCVNPVLPLNRLKPLLASKSLLKPSRTMTPRH